MTLQECVFARVTRDPGGALELAYENPCYSDHTCNRCGTLTGDKSRARGETLISHSIKESLVLQNMVQGGQQYHHLATGENGALSSTQERLSIKTGILRKSSINSQEHEQHLRHPDL